MQKNKINLLKATFDLPLHAKQLAQFRGAVAESAGLENDLFHNHKGENEFHYRYPLIQYKLNKGKACMVGIGEGVDALFTFLLKSGRRIIGRARNYPCAFFR